MVQARDVRLRFRDGRPQDAVDISDLARHTFTENFGSIYKKADLDAYLDRFFSVARVEQDLHNPDIEYRVAETSSSLVGYAKIGPPVIQLERPVENLLQLYRLYVRETRQGVGVGGILLSWAIDRARERGMDELCLGVWSNSTHAIGVYENRGFKADGFRDISVGSTIDRELIMTLPLRQKAKISA